MKTESGISFGHSLLDRAPKSRAEIETLLVADLRTYSGCELALKIAVVAIGPHGAPANWTVSCFDPGPCDGDACDRALQHIVPRLQRIYELVQKH